MVFANFAVMNQKHTLYGESVLVTMHWYYKLITFSAAVFDDTGNICHGYHLFDDVFCIHLVKVD